MDEIYLIDTHCWLNWHINPDRLSPKQFQIMQDSDNDIYFSTVSAWEINIKYRMKQIKLPSLPFRYIPDRIKKDQLNVLSFSLEHSLRTENLPPHHNDPFDRLLITQAQLGNMTILTDDRRFEFYDVKIIR